MGPTVLNTALFYCTVGPKLGPKLGLKLGPKLGLKILSIELPPWCLENSIGIFHWDLAPSPARYYMLLHEN